MVYGYARVSTIKQEVIGNSLEDQEKVLREAGAQEIVFDQFTGRTMDRPNFQKLLDRLQTGDKLVMTKLDRFARTTIDGCTVIKKLQDNGVTVHILNLGVIDNTPTGKLITTIFLAFAEYEHAMIEERTKIGKAIARDKGVRVDGRPLKYSKAQMNHAINLLSDYSYTQVAQMTGISKSTLTREKRRRIERSIENEKD